MTRKIGYARVSSADQNLDRQIAALRAEGCDVIFREKASGKSTLNRPQLESAIDHLGTGDVLVVAEWDRATRSMLDGVKIIDRIHQRGALLRVLDKPWLDLSSAIGQGVMALLSALAQDERERIGKRAREGRDAARLAGKHLGRRPKLNDYQRAEAQKLLAAGKSCRDVGRLLGVHHSTVSRLHGC